MWPAVAYETCAWERDPDELAIVPKSRRRKILPTYEAAVPASIAVLPVEIPAPLARRIAEVEVSLARFDTAQAAIFHAQFETIHPFTDGNGRAGRALLHRMLARDEVLLHTMLPVSAGLLHDVERYLGALDAYHDGIVEPIVECLADALELAVVIGARIASDVDGILVGWASANTDRAGSASHRLPALLVEQPVVDVAFVASRLGITDRAARDLVETACERGILAKMGNARRGAFYQAPDLIAVLEEASSLQGIRRIVAR